MMHFRGIPPRFDAQPAPICDLRGEGETTTEVFRVTCPECRKVLKLDGKAWSRPKPRERQELKAASRELLDSGDDESDRRFP